MSFWGPFHFAIFDPKTTLSTYHQLLIGLPAAIAASGFAITEVVSGGARGVDVLGERYADFAGIPVQVFPADWETHGRAAGPIRNRQMAVYADALIAVWDGKSRGPKSMIDTVRDLGLKVYVHIVDSEADETS